MSAAGARASGWSCATAAALALQAAVSFPTVETASPGGHFIAVVEKAPGQERTPDALARWRVVVDSSPARAGEPLWSAPLRHDAEPRRYALSEDGRAFAAVDELYTQSRALVRIASADGGATEYGASALGLERADFDRETRRWLSDGADACRWRWFETPAGATPFLALALASGAPRWIDVGAREVLLAPPGPREIVVEPSVGPDFASRSEVPYVHGRTVPARIRWGEVLEIEVWGEHPTPNWRVVGFEVSVGEGSIALVPRSEPPKGVQLQVLDSFRSRVRVHGLAPGTYAIEVHGREAQRLGPAAVEVERAPCIVELTRRGGILGLDERLRLFATGIALLESNRMPGGPHASFASAEDLARIRRLLSQCEHEPAPASILGSDLIESTLAWEREHGRFRSTTNAPEPAGAWRELLELLVRLRP